MDRVSVIIPVYNAGRFLRMTLDSALAEQGVDVEVVAVDDGSTDDSPAILAGYGDRIIVHTQQNAGQASAMNAALALSTGEFIAYLDADDLCIPGRLAEQVRYLHEHPDIDLVYSSRENIDADGRSLGGGVAPPHDPLALLYTNYIPASSVMHRRESLERTGLFDTSYGNHDWDYWVRASEQGRMGRVRRSLIQYRIHERSISRSRSRPLNHYRLGRMIMLKKTWERRGRPRWLRALYVRARIEWWMLANPLWSERGGRVWWKLHNMWNAVERRLVWTLVRDRTSPPPWRDGVSTR